MAHWFDEAMGPSSAPPHIPDRASIQEHPNGDRRTTGCLNCGRELISPWWDGDEDRSGSWGRWGHEVKSPNGNATAYRQTCEAQDMGTAEGQYMTPETVGEMAESQGKQKRLPRLSHFFRGRSESFIPKNSKPPF